MLLNSQSRYKKNKNKSQRKDLKLITSNPTPEKISAFVDAGSANLAKHKFMADNLNVLKARQPAPVMATGLLGDSPEGDGDGEMPVNFRLNQTGNIFYSTTSPVLQEQTKKLFDSVTVLFSAMTKALSEKKKTIFDYDAWSSIVAKSGYFVEVQKFEKFLVIENSALSIDTQMVQQLLPGLKSGSSMEIAKTILSAFSGTFSSGKVDEKTRVGHMLFICEELFGAPSITVRIFYASKESHTSVTASPCHRRTNTKIEQLQQANTFLFVSPEAIAEFAEKFDVKTPAYQNLVNELAGYVDDDPKA